MANPTTAPHQNSTRLRFRLSAERSRRRADRLAAYIAQRERKIADQQIAEAHWPEED